MTTRAEEAHAALEAEIAKSRPERAAAVVAGIGEPIAIVVAGWLMIEAEALERRAGERIGFASEDAATMTTLRELARVLQDATTDAAGTLEP